MTLSACWKSVNVGIATYILWYLLCTYCVLRVYTHEKHSMCLNAHLSAGDLCETDLKEMCGVYAEGSVHDLQLQEEVILFSCLVDVHQLQNVRMLHPVMKT